MSVFFPSVLFCPSRDPWSCSAMTTAADRMEAQIKEGRLKPRLTRSTCSQWYMRGRSANTDTRLKMIAVSNLAAERRGKRWQRRVSSDADWRKTLQRGREHGSPVLPWEASCLVWKHLLYTHLKIKMLKLWCCSSLPLRMIVCIKSWN